MSIYLFFNIITTFVNAQIMVITEFLDACKIEILNVLSATLWWSILGLTIGQKSLFTEEFLPNLETEGNHLVPGQENMVDNAFLQIISKFVHRDFTPMMSSSM